MKLHLGCGKRYLKGYVHVDLADFPHIDHRHSIERLPMFEDNCADVIYSSHALGYFDRFEVLEVLADWRRVLKPGGILRLAMPDFESLVKVYLKYGELDRVLGPIFGRWPVPGTDTVIFQKTVYDYPSMQKVLEQAGFEQVRRWDWRQVFVGELQGYDDYSQAYVPHMDKDNGILISLNTEAVKPEK